MSFGRQSQQWATFARNWHIINVDRQPVGGAASLVCRHLEGRHKPIYYSNVDCGDHVVVVNSEQVAFSGNKWEQKLYVAHNRRRKGRLEMRAFEIHQLDPTWIIKKMIYSHLSKVKTRRDLMTRLHIFKDENVPPEIMENVTSVIKPSRRIPKTIFEYSPEEINSFPRLWEEPPDFIKE